MAHDLEQLKQDHPDVAKLFAGDWLQYRKSEILPELTREAQSTCDRINRIYFEDTAEAERQDAGIEHPARHGQQPREDADQGQVQHQGTD